MTDVCDRVCASCRYHCDGLAVVPGTYRSDQIISHCRRYAPRTISGAAMGCENKLFPEVTPDMWCGEWEQSNEQL